MKLIWKLLKENISKGQLIGFSLANFVGMAIILLAVQVYSDISPVFQNKEDLFKKDYFVVTKQVGLLSLFSNNTSFSDDEINEVKKQSFVRDVGSFNPSQFNVAASFSYPSKGIHFNTQMFFESVPVQFIDVKTNDWGFSPIDNSVPIILPKDYLDLYNFGFAQSQSMPKISEDIIKMIKLDIMIAGRGQTANLKGRIVGFSSRINTILVPEEFMKWANQNYGSTQGVKPSRLILDINDITDPQISSFFASKGYEVSNDNTAVSKASFLLKTMVSIVVLVGVVICLLSLFVLTLSVHLLLEKNMTKLQNLRILGYKKHTITRPYELLTLAINGVTILSALVVVVIARSQYCELLKGMWSNVGENGMWSTLLLAGVVFILLSSFNTYTIRKKVK